MITFNSILIYGHPDHVDLKMLEHAADIAKYNRSHVKIIHVVDDYPKDASTWWNVRNPGKLSENIAREREDFLDGLAESLKKLGVEDVSRKLLWGKPSDEVSKEMLSGKHDLVMFASTNGNRIGYDVQSRSLSDLIRECSCPIWVAQKKVKKQVNRILACIGGNTEQIEADDINAKILEHAVAAAKAQSSELHIAHLMPFHDAEGGPQGKTLRLNYDITAYLDNVRHKIRTRCNGILSKHDISLNDEQIHPMVGPTDLAIPEFVQAKGADLVVMATAVHKGLHGFLVGSTAEKVLKKIDCPILVVKPDVSHERSNSVQNANSSAA